MSYNALWDGSKKGCFNQKFMPLDQTMRNNPHCVICKLMMFKGSPWGTCLRETKASIS